MKQRILKEFYPFGGQYSYVKKNHTCPRFDRGTYGLRAHRSSTELTCFDMKRTTYLISIEDWWKQHPRCPKAVGQKQAVQGLNRVSIGRVLSAHGDFADYHQRFGHDTEPTYQSGRMKFPLHIWTCAKRNFRLSENFVATMYVINFSRQTKA
jgi:hypothetical protein